MFNFVDAKELKMLRKSVETLLQEKQDLKVQIEELKLKKRLEEEEIKHMVKIKEEKNRIELENAKIKMEREYADKLNKFLEEQSKKLATIMEESHGKLEGRFNTELANLKEVYGLLMSRLPNVNLTLEKRLK